MEDIIALKVTDSQKGLGAFLTWGRIFDRIDSTELIKVITPHLATYGIMQPTSVLLCDTLREVACFAYFYESFFMMSQTKIPFGPTYVAWKTKMAQSIKAGDEVYFLGFLDSAKSTSY